MLVVSKFRRILVLGSTFIECSNKANLLSSNYEACERYVQSRVSYPEEGADHFLYEFPDELPPELALALLCTEPRGTFPDELLELERVVEPAIALGLLFTGARDALGRNEDSQSRTAESIGYFTVMSLPRCFNFELDRCPSSGGLCLSLQAVRVISGAALILAVLRATMQSIKRSNYL